MKCAVITQRICEKIEPGKKMVQKLFYLMERKGVKLNLNYIIHFFGPYSSKLDSDLHTLESYNIIEIDTSGMTHIIKKGSELVSEKLEKTDEDHVNYVLENFLERSALELEAITTLDYAATRILSKGATDKDIIRQVIKIKGSKFNERYLEQELKVLKETGYLN